jgi:hypothetical protein
VTRRNPIRQFMLVALLAGVAALPVAAEDVEKKFRIGATVGFFNPQDSVKSDSGNVLTLVDHDLVFSGIFIDPRNDSAVFGALDLQSALSGTLYGQYAISQIFILEASVGYSKQDMGEVELQVQFEQIQIPSFQPFDFAVFRIPVGEVERIPVQFTALARFRPRSSFNPYVGAGIGYTYNGFSVAPEFNALSVALDGARGGLARVTDATFGNPTLIRPQAADIVDLTGATVQIDDTFEAHLAFGIEYSFKRKWALLLDTRWTRSSRSVTVSFNDAGSLGVGVPDRVDFDDSPAAFKDYGGIHIPVGGLVDGGMLVPAFGVNPNHDCVADSSQCVFDATQPDGIPDPGIYYIQGGEFDYGGVKIELGIRYTF